MEGVTETETSSCRNQLVKWRSSEGAWRDDERWMRHIERKVSTGEDNPQLQASAGEGFERFHASIASPCSSLNLTERNRPLAVGRVPPRSSMHETGPSSKTAK